MRLIHCADLHLDSKMNANLEKERAKERKGEILHTFERMITYAAANQVTAILIAGDMFDTKNISATTRNTVLYHMKGHPEITFYYLKGNHDNDNFLSGLEAVPDNLKLFGKEWTTYEEAEGEISISGIELSAENELSAYNSLVLDSRKFNIVMLHGQESKSAVKDKAEVINMKALRNKGIDYLALGHVHAYKMERLDARGTYCYPGCLEGRGFDECGEHGFVVLDIDVGGKGTAWAEDLAVTHSISGEGSRPAKCTRGHILTHAPLGQADAMRPSRYTHPGIPHQMRFAPADSASPSRYTREFVPFAQRKLYSVDVDVSGAQTTAEMISRTEDALEGAGCDADSLVKIVLKGMMDVECEKDLAYFLTGFRQRFYYVKVYDETTLKIEIEDYLLDESLKGEYVRQVMADVTLSDEDKGYVIRYGLQAIAGEEVQ